MTVERIKIVSTQAGVTGMYVDASHYDALAARLAEAIWVLKAIREDQMHAGGLDDDVHDAWERLCAADSATPATSAAAPREV